MKSKTSGRRALIIVDVQHDFVENGALAVQGGNEVAQRIAADLLGEDCGYDLVVTTQDWHIDPGSHFSENPDFVDSWPVHCVAESHGAAILPAIEEALARTSIPVERIFKGQYEDAYSGFMGHNAQRDTLAQVINESEIDQVDVVGLAEDYCVISTALDAQREGFPATLLRRYTAPIDASNAAIRNGELLKLGGAVAVGPRR